jgi:hypothetical protein
MFMLCAVNCIAARASSWSNLLSDETDVEALGLQIPIEGIANLASGGKGSTKGIANPANCAYRGRVLTHILLLEMSSQAPHIGKGLLSTSIPAAHSNLTGAQTRLSIVGIPLRACKCICPLITFYRFYFILITYT